MLLALNFSLVTNNKINYLDLALLEALTVLVGVALWVVGLDVWRGRSTAHKIGGAVLLLVALGYSLLWMGFNLWEFQQLRQLLA